MDTSINSNLTSDANLISSIILSLLLIISELLGWSKCDAKSISRIPFCLGCMPKLTPPPPPPIDALAHATAHI